MSTSKKQYQPSSNVVFTQLSDSESVLFDLEIMRFYELNETGSRIWCLMKDGMSPEEISIELEKEYDIEQGQAIIHVMDLLEELKQKKLLTFPV
jgi:hypothetical protein